MSRSLHREPNRIKWVGVRPAHDGDDINVSGAATNVQLSLLYTVPAGFDLLLDAFTISCRGAATNQSSLYVRNVADFTLYNLWQHYFPEAWHIAMGISFHIPVEILSGYDIMLHNGVAASYTRAYLHGILIPQ